ncbi:MAG: CotH kinase family protein [Agathobacter sp.]|nr:CotH kinase family protein [Agathobacter sp.]
MKKILYLMLLSTMCFFLTACGGKNTDENNKQTDTSKESESKDETDNAINLSEIADSKVAQPTDVPKVLIYTTNGRITKDAYNSCQIIIVDEKGGKHETIMDSASSAKIRGNSTTAGYKSAYNIKFSEKTNVLGMGKNKKWSLLSNCYDKTLLRNQMVFDFSTEIGVPFTPDYKVVDLYMDDKLKGSYLLVDSVEVSSTRVDIDTSNNEFLLELDYNPQDEDSQYFFSPKYEIKFAINEPEKKDLTTEQYSYLRELISNAEDALETGDIHEIEKYFDLRSMADFYLVLEFFRNVDVNTSSTRFHVKDGKIYGGPVWDFDLSAGNYRRDYYHNLYDENGNSYAGLYAVRLPWFGVLVELDEFQSLVNQKFLDMQDLFVNLYEDNELGQNYIDKTIETYNGTISRNYGEAGWKPNRIYCFTSFLERRPDSTYEENVEFLRVWLKNRNEWLLEEWDLK